MQKYGNSHCNLSHFSLAKGTFFPWAFTFDVRLCFSRTVVCCYEVQHIPKTFVAGVEIFASDALSYFKDSFCFRISAVAAALAHFRARVAQLEMKLAEKLLTPDDVPEEPFRGWFSVHLQ